MLITECWGISSADPSSFFAAHNAKAYFETLTNIEGYEVDGGKSGSDTWEKNFVISIKADEAASNNFMGKYKDYVEKQLHSAGLKIHGRTTWGESKFDFNYTSPEIHGVIRVNSVINNQGYLEIDIFIYEHK